MRFSDKEWEDSCKKQSCDITTSGNATSTPFHVPHVSFMKPFTVPLGTLSSCENSCSCFVAPRPFMSMSGQSIAFCDTLILDLGTCFNMRQKMCSDAQDGDSHCDVSKYLTQVLILLWDLRRRHDYLGAGVSTRTFENTMRETCFSLRYTLLQVSCFVFPVRKGKGLLGRSEPTCYPYSRNLLI